MNSTCRYGIVLQSGVKKLGMTVADDGHTEKFLCCQSLLRAARSRFVEQDLKDYHLNDGLITYLDGLD